MLYDEHLNHTYVSKLDDAHGPFPVDHRSEFTLIGFQNYFPAVSSMAECLNNHANGSEVLLYSVRSTF